GAGARLLDELSAVAARGAAPPRGETEGWRVVHPLRRGARRGRVLAVPRTPGLLRGVQREAQGQGQEGVGQARHRAPCRTLVLLELGPTLNVARAHENRRNLSAEITADPSKNRRSSWTHPSPRSRRGPSSRSARSRRTSPLCSCPR